MSFLARLRSTAGVGNTTTWSITSTFDAASDFLELSLNVDAENIVNKISGVSTNFGFYPFDSSGLFFDYNSNLLYMFGNTVEEYQRPISFIQLKMQDGFVSPKRTFWNNYGHESFPGNKISIFVDKITTSSETIWGGSDSEVNIFSNLEGLSLDNNFFKWSEDNFDTFDSGFSSFDQSNNVGVVTFVPKFSFSFQTLRVKMKNGAFSNRSFGQQTNWSLVSYSSAGNFFALDNDIGSLGDEGWEASIDGDLFYPVQVQNGQDLITVFPNLTPRSFQFARTIQLKTPEGFYTNTFVFDQSG